jgi:hypothetical protein
MLCSLCLVEVRGGGGDEDEEKGGGREGKG